MTEKLITKNKKAFHEFEVVERFEAGVVLVGTEVKSIREGKINLKEAYAKIKQGEVWLMQCHINPYSHGTSFNHDPVRPRKLLLHRAEIRRLFGKVKEKGMTLVPLAATFRNGRVKIELGLAKGKSTVDKRHAEREKDDKREMQKLLKRRTRDEH